LALARPLPATTRPVMLITAKFASVCPCCSQRIQVGSKVEWSKGSPAKHTACAQGSTSTVSAAPARGSSSWRNQGGRWNGCSMGCREGNPNPRCKSCMFDEFDC
jgi:hypothetical protein